MKLLLKSVGAANKNTVAEKLLSYKLSLYKPQQTEPVFLYMSQYAGSTDNNITGNNSKSAALFILQ